MHSKLLVMKKLFLFFLLMIFLILNLQSFEKQQTVFAYSSSIEDSGATFILDFSHEPYHDNLDNLFFNLSLTGNSVILNDEEFQLPLHADALFIPDPYIEFTSSEKQIIKEWFEQGSKLLFISGDSDYGGYFQPEPVNNLLTYLDAQIRLDSTSISDTVYNDGADYRVAAVTYGTTPTALTVSEGCEAGCMMHGPCAILGYNDSKYVNLRNTTLPNVEVLLSYSENAIASDADVSSKDTDLYSLDNLTAFENGNYPAVVYEKITTSGSSESHLILAGEAIYSDYKFMYEQRTESGVYNGNVQYGFKFVNNIINYFVERKYYPDQIISINNDTDFVNYGFPGAGNQSDPYVIDGFSFNETGYFGISIKNTTKYAIIQNCEFYNLYLAISLENIENGTIKMINNNFKYNLISIESYESDSININNNTIDSGINGILVIGSENNEIANNTIKNCLSYGVTLDNFTKVCEIHHNSFINNSLLLAEDASQAYDDGIDNDFHDNFWSDHIGNGVYLIDGDAGSVDSNPFVIISEFSLIAIHMLVLVSLSIVIIRLLNQRK